VITIPLSTPQLQPEDLAAVMDCLNSGIISTYSPLVPKFEVAMASFLDVPDALALNCGTSALHLALLVAGVKPGNLVAVPALTFVATANPVHYVGATPICVDVDPVHMGMCPTQLANTLAIHPHIKAIVVTHLYGHTAPMAALRAVAGPHRVIIEDAAEALGSHSPEGLAGTLGDVGCFSFNGNKTLTTGSGGLLVSRHPQWLAHARHLASQAKPPEDATFHHTEVGYNYRMNGIQAALGLAQINRLPQWLQAKRELAQAYTQALAPYPHIDTTPLQMGLQAHAHMVPWLVTVLAEHANHQAQLLTHLQQAGVQARPFFKPLPLLPMFTQQPVAQYPNAMALWQQGLCLPSSPNLSLDHVAQIAQLIISQKPPA
jgi:perosamine synthetase